MIERLNVQSREMVDKGADFIVNACGGLGQVAGNAGWHTLEHRGALIPLTTAVKTAEMSVAMGKGLGWEPNFTTLEPQAPSA
jgi:hypothetical protein